MVAKILRSTSFLMTRLDLTPSFSDSSLTVMPSPIVISRSIGGGATSWRFGEGRNFPSSFPSMSRLRSMSPVGRGFAWCRRPGSVGGGAAGSIRPSGDVGCRCGRPPRICGEPGEGAPGVGPPGLPGPPCPGRSGPRKIGCPGAGCPGRVGPGRGWPGAGAARAGFAEFEPVIRDWVVPQVEQPADPLSMGADRCGC